ncbi:BRCA1-associated protein [Cryptococcus deuterogattii 99/473]|uniref:Unplaced genomic scaffold supercont1.4, whole genome shotgun sequence n=1 Tax=Cryptococcus deuterogattii Ram5 TaxID=1296110 RepID=A0A0D0V6B9_9TREE|nr:BRCA1-associated protein [Cryptococcus deuterogattii Ram5]KIR98826.1 BRCA1-associated protein [Cryptococcus deuterogattii 2001/935-1]KIY55999.1 BRCA1-associated protein [Cryptococcus deuterogattii 99/473]
MPIQLTNLYSIIIAIHSPASETQQQEQQHPQGADWRLGDITVDWVDFTREKSVGKRDMPRNQHSSSQESKNRLTPQGRSVPGSSTAVSNSKPKTSRSQTPTQHKSSKDDPDSLSLQPLLAHFPSPTPMSSSYAQGISSLGTGVVHLFRHAPPPSLIADIDNHPFGSSSRSAGEASSKQGWSGESAEGEDGSLIAILAVPAWMRPADFLEFIGGWGTCLEGVRMIREATTPNRSIVLLKFRDPLQAQDFTVIFTGRAFSTLDSRETCHPIRIHHLVLHKLDQDQAMSQKNAIAIPVFPSSVYASRAKQLPELLSGVPTEKRYELPSCPVCLERLDSTVTGLVTLPCAHTFDCDCLRKWGDSRCPVCRLSHLLLSSSSSSAASSHSLHGREITRLTKCSCGRYEPGKGHARRHWEESGHVLAMELETQRVWDYKGDNYVHRLIQTKNDGKLVELPSASSLVTPSVPRVMPLGNSQRPTSSTSAARSMDICSTSEHQAQAHIQGHAGPSSNDIDKISTIESITLEYSYLLSSQLESMRQHYEKSQSTLETRLEELERRGRETEEKLKGLEKAEKEREKAERKMEKALELSKGLQSALGAERAMSQGLSDRVKVLERERDEAVKGKKDKEAECETLEETVRDLMFSLEAGMKIKELGGDSGEGGDLMVVPGKESNRGKKKTRK